MCEMMLRALFRILWVVFTISGDLYELDDEKTFLSFSLTVHHFLGTVATVISRLCFYFLFIYLFSHFHLVKMALQRKKKKSLNEGLAYGLEVPGRSAPGLFQGFFLNHITFLSHHFNQGLSLAKKENNVLGQLVLIIGIAHQTDYTPNPFHAKQEKSTRKRQYESVILNTLNCKV